MCEITFWVETNTLKVKPFGKDDWAKAPKEGKGIHLPPAKAGGNSMATQFEATFAKGIELLRVLTRRLKKVSTTQGRSTGDD